MKKIQLQRLTLRNFKGLENKTIDFKEQTEIHGRNGIGKTTIFDGFSWLLFGKNSENSTDFNLKPLDKFNKPLHNLETEAEGTLLVDGETIILKRTFREKWTKKKGNEVAELTGHETTFTINDVPLSLSDYKKKVSEIIDEELSKVLINPLFFNVSLNWKKRREILSQMVGEISDEEILSQMKNKDELLLIINSDKNLEDEKKVLNAKKKKIKEEIETIPARMDEARRSLPEAINFEELEAEIDLKEIAFQELDELILNSSKGNEKEIQEIEAKQNELSKLKNELFEKKEAFEIDKRKKSSEIRTKIFEAEEEIKSENRKAQELKIKFEEISLKLKSKETLLNSTRSTWTETNKASFVIEENSTCCPTCKRELEDASEIALQLESNFNKDKEERLEQLKQNGIKIASEIEELKKELESLISSLEAVRLTSSIEIEKLKNELKQIEDRKFSSELEKQIEEFKIPELEKKDNSILIEQRSQKKTEIDSLKSKLTDKFLIKKIEARIEELQKQQKDLSQEIASIEKIEMQIEIFNKLKVETIETKVNSMFKLVSFKMFEEQLNGGTSETCVALVGGVPFTDLNTASKINAGLDVLKALQTFFQVSFPVFVDGRESVTEIIEIDCQVVSLVVNPESKELTIK